MKRIFFAAVWFLLTAPAFAFCQHDTTINHTVAKLQSFLTTRVSEKVYLHLDKPFYASGDTIYFKAYVTMGERHELSRISGVLHVDLINKNNKIDRSIKLKIDSGVTWGDIALPDSLPYGNYLIRAYTRWMKNAGEGSFFNKEITIAGTNGKPVIYESGRAAKPVTALAFDVQFFPEGGELVTGISSTVAFKAVGANGLGARVKGIVVDNEGKEVTSFVSARLGMGEFSFTPAAGKTYKANITLADGTQSRADLPVAVEKGVTLSVDNDAIPKATVKIAASSAFFNDNKNKIYTLLIYSGGIVTTVSCKLDSQVISLDILKRHLKTGTATVTLFAPTGEPLCERLFFVQNYDQLNLDISSDKAIYTARDNVNIKITALNRRGEPATGHFSVSVTDESRIPVDENTEQTILTDLLLTSDLKGYVEQPAYYFNDTSATARKDLDILMLTQGYRRFAWKDILNDGPRVITFLPEKGLDINGRVSNVFSKPVADGTVTLLPGGGGPLLTTKSDDKGLFQFKSLLFTDTTHFVLSAVNDRGKNSTKLTWLTEKPEPVTQQFYPDPPVVADTAIANYLASDKAQQQELVKFGHAKGIMLKEVRVRDKKMDDAYQTQSLAGAGFADQVMHADEIGKIQGPLTMSLLGRLHGVRFIGRMGNLKPALTMNGLAPMPMLVIIDGTQGGDINLLNASDVETVEVLKYASASIYGMNGGNGVLVITTKQGGGLRASDIEAVGVLPIAPMGFYAARQFYSPRYEPGAIATKQRDLRSTIYWNPEIQTGSNGNASFSFNNADGTGTYRVVIEGIDDHGNIGRQVLRYKVE